jgi:hypothetical protein
VVLAYEVACKANWVEMAPPCHKGQRGFNGHGGRGGRRGQRSSHLRVGCLGPTRSGGVRTGDTLGRARAVREWRAQATLCWPAVALDQGTDVMSS